MHGVYCWIVDFKVDTYEGRMGMIHYAMLPDNSYVKFVVRNLDECSTAFEYMKMIEINRRQFTENVLTFAFSAITNELTYEELFEWMRENRINAILNVQIHKLIQIREGGKENVAKKELTTYGNKVGTQAGQIYKLLCDGASIEDMMKEVDCKKGRILSHIKHLTEKKGFEIIEKEGIWKVAKNAENEAKKQ